MPPFTSAYSLVRLIKSTVPAVDLPRLQLLHSLALKLGLSVDDFVSSALISSYGSAGHLDAARRLFDEIPLPGLVPQTSMARAHLTNADPARALELFSGTVSSGVSPPDTVALATAIMACHLLGDLRIAKVIHGYIISSGIEVDAYVSVELMRVYGENHEVEMSRRVFDGMPVRTPVALSTIMHQYVKHGDIKVAHTLFVEMPNRDTSSWNTLMWGYLNAGKYREAMKLFQEMVSSSSSSVKPNKLTMSAVLASCASIGALDVGMWIHSYVGRSGLNSDGSLDHCLIDMYAKCGCIEKAVQVFEQELPDRRRKRRDLYSWTSLICGLAMHGRASDALGMFSQMLQAGLMPDDVTLLGVLNACAHGGLADQARSYFDSMEEMYGLTPKIEHYGCMVDVLGRVGLLKEAYDMILGMPMAPNAVVWGTMLNACKIHNHVQLGFLAASKLIALDPWDQWARVMLSNMYAEAKDWNAVLRLRKEIVKGVGHRKVPGCSSIEVNGEVHEFVAGGILHPQIKAILLLLQTINKEASMQIIISG